jgi:hypothetical protein
MYTGVTGSNKRGCGWRKTNAIYFTCGFSEKGQPLDFWIVDPPRPIAGLNVNPLGVQPIEINGVTHILDWVGSSHYQNVADYLEETRALGVSRRIPSTFPFERLSPESKIIMIHARAIVHNQGDYLRGLIHTEHVCPKGIEIHPEAAKPCCAGIWWHDLEPDTATADDLYVKEYAVRKMDSFSYYGFIRRDDIKPIYEPGIFAMFPIGELQVVRPNEDHRVLNNARKAATNGVPVKEMDL